MDKTKTVTILVIVLIIGVAALVYANREKFKTVSTNTAAV